MFDVVNIPRDYQDPPVDFYQFVQIHIYLWIYMIHIGRYAGNLGRNNKSLRHHIIPYQFLVPPIKTLSLVKCLPSTVRPLIGPDHTNGGKRLNNIEKYSKNIKHLLRAISPP